MRSARGHRAISSGSFAIRATSRRSRFALAMAVLRMSDDRGRMTDDRGQGSQRSDIKTSEHLSSDLRHPSSVIRHLSSVFEMSVSDVCEFLAAWRRLRIEPTAHLFTRAAERLRNGVEAVAFAGHALRSHQFLERPGRMRGSPARLASSHFRHCVLHVFDGGETPAATIAAPALSNARSPHWRAPAVARAARAAAPRPRLAYPLRGTSRWH